MKEQAISTLLLAGTLLFSGLIVIAGGSTGWQSENPLPIHRGEFRRETDSLRKAVVKYAPDARMHRCLVHKERNLKRYLAQRDWPDLSDITSVTWQSSNYSSNIA